jgi:hypothetical protein
VIYVLEFQDRRRGHEWPVDRWETTIDLLAEDMSLCAYDTMDDAHEALEGMRTAYPEYEWRIAEYVRKL